MYGNTSQSFQLVALIPLLIDADHYIAIVKVLSALSLVGLFALYARAARTLVAEGSREGWALALGVALLAASAPYVLLLVHSGMETCLAFVVIAINLLAIHRGAESRRDAAAVVATTVLVYLTRPDAVAISLVSMALCYWGRERRVPWRILLACGLALVAVLGLCQLYFGTPLPLAFHLKSRALTIYTADFVRIDHAVKVRNLFGLLVMAAPLLYVAAHGRSAWTAALVASFALFTGYHYFSTIEVMGSYARFYLPGLVPLALAAIEAAPRLRERSRPLVTILFCALYAAGVAYLHHHRIIYDGKDQLISRVAGDLYIGYALAATILLAGARLHAGAVAALAGVPILVTAVTGLRAPAPRLYSDRELLARHIERPTTLRGIRAVEACIPQPFHLYHTEIGVPGVLFPDSTVTDMAGLMDQQIALHGMDFDARCARDRPEVIFLPHRNYHSLRDQIAHGTCIHDYQRVVRDSSSPLYIRKDLIPTFLPCAHRLGDRWIDGGRASPAEGPR
ncbi:MAG TPA: hypothetical protein VKB80_05330 [Kofleriaceae bacterium]|nr:hypothetical protein [Kofleriaceae bacterium]